MKKGVSLLLAILMASLLCLPSFAAEDIYGKYEKSLQKMGKASSVEMTGTMKIAIEMGESKASPDSNFNLNFDMTSKLSSKQIIKKDGSIDMEMHMTTSDILGTEPEKSSVYYKDGYYYSTTGDQKIKIKMPFDETAMSGYDHTDSLSKEFFNNATVEKTETGEKIKIKLSETSMNKYLQELTDDAMSAMTGDDTAAKLSGITYWIYLDEKGDYAGFSMVMTMSFKQDGIPVKASYSIRMNVKSLNSVEKINFPADLASYRTSQ